MTKYNLTLALFLGITVSLVAGTTPPLVDAARNGDVEAIRTLIGQGAALNEAEADGTTALIWASYRDDVSSAGVLISAGADANAANDLGATALWAASQNGSQTMVGLLLEAGADPDRALLAGETPLMVAARSGYPEIVEQLIGKGADPNARGTRDQTALMWAAAQMHADVVETLVANGADIFARSEVWSQVMAVPPHSHDDYNKDIPHGGETALMFAARVGDIASARILVTAGSDVNDADAWGVSATSLATHSDFSDLVDYLLAEGADPNASDPGFTALHNAIMHRDEHMVEALLAHGADANARLETWTPTRRSSQDHNYAPQLVGATPLWLAARFSTPRVMRLLVEHGADPLFVHHGEYVSNSISDNWLGTNTNITTPLMAALGMGGGRAWAQPDRSQREALMLEAVGLFVDLGVDLNVADTDGRTALDAAMRLEYESVVEILVESGAEPGNDEAEPRRGAR